jgi:ATP-dependent exoDNAse (exonuclease V) beta subunit
MFWCWCASATASSRRLLRTLKAMSGIPVAGADRLRLTDHIAVQDLLALGRFVRA